MTITVYEENEPIIDRYIKGEKPTAIAKDVGLPTAQVKSIIKHWNENVRGDLESREFARDMLNRLVEHYDKLIGQFYDLIEDIDSSSAGNLTHQWTGQKISALRSIADLESKRADLIQKAGGVENDELGDQLAQMEKDKEILIEILRDDLCANCRPEVMRKLGQVTGRVEVVVVSD